MELDIDYEIDVSTPYSLCKYSDDELKKALVQHVVNTFSLLIKNFISFFYV
jgi:hypothetical protein